MKLLKLSQGSEEWHTHRSTARNASEASVLMGESKHEKYESMVMRRALGLEKEHSDYVKSVIFPRGHEVEEATRPLVEASQNLELFPLVGVSDDEYLSASFDGITFDFSTIWECKQWNRQKIEAILSGIVPPCDYWQVVQQMAVSGAERCIYSVSSGDHYESIEVLRSDVKGDFENLLEAWAQFDIDVKNYKYDNEKRKPICAV